MSVIIVCCGVPTHVNTMLWKNVSTYAQKQWTYKPQDRVFIVLLFSYKDINRVETTSLYDTTYRQCSLSGKQLLPPQYQMTPTSETISGASYRQCKPCLSCRLLVMIYNGAAKYLHTTTPMIGKVVPFVRINSLQRIPEIILWSSFIRLLFPLLYEKWQLQKSTRSVSCVFQPQRKVTCSHQAYLPMVIMVFVMW